MRLSQKPKEAPSTAISMLTSRQAAGAWLCAAPSFVNSASRVMLHRREFLQPRPQPIHLPAAHAAFLGDAIPALGKHVEFPVLREQLHPHLGTHLIPRFHQQSLCERTQATLGRCHTRYCTGGVYRTAAQCERGKIPQRRLICGVACQDLIGQWKAPAASPPAHNPDDGHASSRVDVYPHQTV